MTRLRCLAKTKRGERCLRSVSGGYGDPFCIPHRDADAPIPPAWVTERLAEAAAELSGWIRRGSDAWQRGYEDGQKRRASQEAREAERAARFALTRGGRQIVCVGRYAYLCPEGVTLEVGDSVHLPGNCVVPYATWAAITSLGSDYDGQLVSVLGYRRAEEVAA